jgi:immune inhibitor A
MKSKIALKTLVVAMAISITAPLALASPPDPGKPGFKNHGHVKEHPLGKKKAALKKKALEAKLMGVAQGATFKVAHGQFVELEREGEDLIWTVLAEFSNLAHNEIPEPNRWYNNSTIWKSDFSRNHYMDILFNDEPGANSMHNYYIEQSSNRYTVDGDVTEWITVPGLGESYDDGISGGVWNLIDDAVTGWADSQMLAGLTDAEIEKEVAQYDVWDRYDYDGDGNFDEADGYIDHFQLVHAGQGEEVGGGVLGEAAIWSHRSYARSNLIGSDGPEFNKQGGVEIPGTGLWIGDYTVEPENGGVGVFAHEFGHDLDLPDLYDTGGGSNSTGFWTLMSSGSWLSDGGFDIGSMPGHMGAWEKIQLGWFNHDTAHAGEISTHKLGPAEGTSKKAAQGLLVILPEKVVTEEIGSPFEGNQFYYSGKGDDVDNTMVVTASLTGRSSLKAMVNYAIEPDYDYAYLRVSTDDGANWTNIETSRSVAENPNGQNFGFGITGSSDGQWVELTADLAGHTGEALIGFRYWTDGGYIDPGLMIDNIQIDDGLVAGAEIDDGWVLSGFSSSTGTETESHFNAYVAENRVYRGYDANLRVGPYNFGFTDQEETADWVERYSYQDGLLISYWDESFTDNNVSAHPGGGLILPIDSHPEPMYRPDGELWEPRVQSYDSTFTTRPTEPLFLHYLSEISFHFPQFGERTFNDMNEYWSESNPQSSVIVPKTGTEIYIARMGRRHLHARESQPYADGKRKTGRRGKRKTGRRGNIMKVQVSPVR